MEDNIKMDRKEIGREVVNWIHLAEDTNKERALLKRVMKLPVP